MSAFQTHRLLVGDDHGALSENTIVPRMNKIRAAFLVHIWTRADLRRAPAEIAAVLPTCDGLAENDQQSGCRMYRPILLPPAGSELSQQAIDYGMALAKSVNAKVIIMTVSTPFHTFAVDGVARIVRETL